MKNTSHLYGDIELDIGKLIHKYDLKDYEILNSLYNNAISGRYNNVKGEYKKIYVWEKTREVLYKKYDILPRKQFDQRSYYGCTYCSVIDLLNQKIYPLFLCDRL